MNKLYLKLYSITFAILLTGATSLNAQVTIGSGEKPAEGALLDLKQESKTDGAANSHKGLGLPRVKLTNKANLFPMFSDDTDYRDNTEGKKEIEDSAHTGLVVYNINTDFCEEIYPGVQVWDGVKWNPLTKGVFPSETDILIDKRDPTKPVNYKIGKFDDAGWWMLENLRAEIWPDGNTTDLNISKNLPAAQYTPGDTEARYYYPNFDEQYFLDNPHHGYVYSWNAAARTSTTSQEANEATKGQGICPNGWHLPTFEEWEQLREAVRKNPCKFAHSNINEDTGYNMQSQVITPNGVSRSPEQGGFNGALVGRISFSNAYPPDDPQGLKTSWFGERALYFTSNTTSTFALISDLNQAYFWNGNTGFMSVRCKKDDVVE